jgi:pyrroloquinoline quinone biosynthesis protein D
VIDEAAVPRFRRGIRFRLDPVRDCWVLLAPEKLFLPDETAVEILKLVDGRRTVAGIADELAARFDAPRAVIAADVLATFSDLVGKGAVQV